MIGKMGMMLSRKANQIDQTDQTSHTDHRKSGAQQEADKNREQFR